MKDTKEEVLDFLDKCEQLRKSKFIMATTRIKDVLKSIVNSAALYELFHAVTADFDYVSAKRKYLITTHEGLLSRSRMVLPDSPADKLAFIFCLLVEFDHNSINFNEFLQQFFAEDGSYYSSFHSFCDKVIVSLESIVAELFTDEIEGTQSAQSAADTQNANIHRGGNEAPNPAVAEKLSAVSLLIAREKNIISCSGMPEADKQDGISMLCELESAVREGRAQSVDAILRGYEYYSACHNGFSQLINLLSAAMEV
jgi:hypothetical protein